MSPNHGSRALIVSARFGKRKKCIQIVLIGLFFLKSSMTSGNVLDFPAIPENAMNILVENERFQDFLQVRKIAEIL